MRQDLPPSQQAVQSCHACLESGSQYRWHGDHPHLVLSGVPDETSLRAWANAARKLRFQVVEFLEPDLNNSLTSIVVSNVCGRRRAFFSALSPLKLSGGRKMTAVQGRWGFYPCSYELYRKLKRLNYLCLLARQRLAAWERWNRKLPENRILRKYTSYQSQTDGRWYREMTVLGPMPEPELAPGVAGTFDLRLLDVIYTDYRNARFPKASAAEVKPLTLSESKIDSLLASLEEWAQQQVAKAV